MGQTSKKYHVRQENEREKDKEKGEALECVMSSHDCCPLISSCLVIVL
jgi:hypothetical protein